MNDETAPARGARRGEAEAAREAPRAEADREAAVERATAETRVRAEITLDRIGAPRIETGLRFLDHMLTACAFHGGFDLRVTAEGDLPVDDHHTVEDCALTIGRALGGAVGDRAGIRRFGSAYAPLDEALARVVVDFSGRPHAMVDLGIERERLGAVSCENLPHFFRSLAVAAEITLHVDVLRGENDHHRAEAAFKALGLALRDAMAPAARLGIPSTKGRLT